MKTVSLNDQPAVEDIIRETQTEEVLVVRDGHAVALVIPFDDDDADWYARESDPSFVESIRRAREQISQGQTIDAGDLRKELGL